MKSPFFIRAAVLLLVGESSFPSSFERILEVVPWIIL